MGKIYVVGIGPGCSRMMTEQAKEVLHGCDVIVGYRTYVDLVREEFSGKIFYESAMRQETERCLKCIEFALEGKTVALICSGDAGIYGMASPLLEMADREGFADVEIIPGITAASSGAALLGAPIGHDVCLISLSDLLTDWAVIEKRLICAAEGDFCIVLYNPASKNRKDHLSKACKILLTRLPPDTPLKPPPAEVSALSDTDDVTSSDVLSDSVSAPLLHAVRAIAPARISAMDLCTLFICPSEK